MTAKRKVKCTNPKCHGTGKLPVEAKDMVTGKLLRVEWFTCNGCKGTGTVWR